MCSSSLIGLSLFAILSSANDIDNSLIRRLQVQTPTNFPTQSPSVSSCKFSMAGEQSPIANPSSISMGTISLSTAVSDIDLEPSPLDTNLNADNAKTWCQTHFGANSKPVTPTDQETWDAVINICEALGNGESCYLGLYRTDYNAAQSDCESWRGEDAVFSTSSDNLKTGYGGVWAANQPSCPWLDSAHSRYLQSTTKHCLEYRTGPNKIRVADCKEDLHIVCEFHGTCSP